VYWKRQRERERVRKNDKRVEAKVKKILGRREIHFISGGRNNILSLEGVQAEHACPSGKVTM
jgi:hypothetical protein